MAEIGLWHLRVWTAVRSIDPSHEALADDGIVHPAFTVLDATDAIQLGDRLIHAAAHAVGIFDDTDDDD